MELLRYFVLVSIAAAGLWVIYYVLLRNRAEHRLNRGYLLLSLTLPAILPLLHLPGKITPAATLIPVTLPEFAISGTAPPAGSDPGFWITLIYTAGSLVVTTCYLIGFFRFRRVLGKHSTEHYADYTLLRNTGYGPGTIGRSVFIPGEMVEPAVLRHELAHIRSGHRFDLTLLMLSRVLYWISPAHWLMGRELKIVHEFEADRIASAQSSSQDYSGLLLGLQFGLNQAPVISHAFFHHPLKRRIMMLQRKTGTRPVLAIAAFVLAAGFTTTVVLAHKGGGIGTTTQARATPLDTVVLQRNYMQPQPGTVGTTADGRIVFTKVDRMPYFNGNMYKWLMDNVRSPQKEMDGKVIVQFTVDAAGNVTLPFISQSSNNAMLDAEALRVVNAMPRWTPGMQGGKAVPVLYQLPFMFGHLGEGC